MMTSSDAIATTTATATATTPTTTATTTATPTVLVLPSISPAQDVVFLQQSFLVPLNNNVNNNNNEKNCQVQHFTVQLVNETSCLLQLLLACNTPTAPTTSTSSSTSSFSRNYSWLLIFVQANHAGRAALVVNKDDHDEMMINHSNAKSKEEEEEEIIRSVRDEESKQKDEMIVASSSSLSLSLLDWQNIRIGNFSVLEFVFRDSNARLVLLSSQVVTAAGNELALYLSSSLLCNDNNNKSSSLVAATAVTASAVPAAAPAKETKATLSKVSPQRQRFLPLQAQLLGCNNIWQNSNDFCCLNSIQPIPFETDLFQGRVLALVRPLDSDHTQDSYWHERIWNQKKRRLVLQIQGQFKRQPVGILYAGAEISQSMQLGLITKGLCNVLLKLVKSFQSNVHSSFGNGTDQEKAHIVVPAYTFFERIVVTKPNETPPPMEEIFDESVSSRTQRQRSAQRGKYGNDWNTVDTYSFSFYSMYIDLATWKLVNLPISGDIALQTFWGHSLLTLCMYEHRSSSSSTTPTTDTVANTTREPHTSDTKQYAFGLQIKYLGHEKHESEDEDEMEEDEEEDADIMRWTSSSGLSTPFVREQHDKSMDRSESNVFQISDEEENNNDEDEDDEFVEYFFDAAEESFHGASMDDLGISFDERSGTEQVAKEPIEHVLLRQIDQACPGWVEICPSRSGYSKFFAVVRDGQLTLHPAQDCQDLVQDSKWANRTVEDTFTPRMSNTERVRRTLGLIISARNATDIPPKKIESFWKQQSEQKIGLLKRQAPSSLDSFPESRHASIQAYAYVARAISDRHWIEEWAMLSNQRISFYHPDKRKSHYHVSASALISVAKLSQDECPAFPNTFYLAISTLGRTIYLMFADETKRNEWFDAVQDILQSSQNDTADNNSVSSGESNASYTLLADVNNPAEEFLHKSTMWSCKNRRLLNCARFSLQSWQVGKRDSLELVESALRLALNVMSDSSSAQADSTMRREFLCAAALLKDADVQSLSEDKKVVFFLNLYHLMILHAYLVLGPPDSSLKWITYFNNIAYQVADDIFSLTELEHCIIRARMSYPSQFLSRFVIPKSLYRFSLTQADFRFNFALNCGSRSNPENILIYNQNDLQDQLDAVSRLYLLKSASVVQKSAREVIVTLPRICQWFRNDFGGSDEAVLKRLEVFLPNKAKRVLAACWLSLERRFDMKCVHLRYLSYQFDCRPLKLYSKGGDQQEVNKEQ